MYMDAKLRHSNTLDYEAYAKALLAASVPPSRPPCEGGGYGDNAAMSKIQLYPDVSPLLQ